MEQGKTASSDNNVNDKGKLNETFVTYRERGTGIINDSIREKQKKIRKSKRRKQQKKNHNIVPGESARSMSFNTPDISSRPSPTYADMWSNMNNDNTEPTEADVGKFIPDEELHNWHKQMQGFCPQVFTEDDKLFGDYDTQHAFGTQLLTYFDDDPNKPMRCKVVGSRWTAGCKAYGDIIGEPVYVIEIQNGLSHIALTSAHEEGGWQVVIDNSTGSETTCIGKPDVSSEEEEEEDYMSSTFPGISSYCYDEDYDAMEHYMNDPVDFQMYGYGGFGYDTSHVPPDGKHSALFNAAEKGDLKKVKGIVSKAKEGERLDIVNHARRWTEVDYRMSGFTKEYEWFDRTSLMIACLKGHVQIVLYLLENGADPGLQACISDDVYTNAKQDAEKFTGGEQIKKQIMDMIEIASKYCSNNINASHARYEKRSFKPPSQKKKLLTELRAVFTNENDLSSENANHSDKNDGYSNNRSTSKGAKVGKSKPKNNNTAKKCQNNKKQDQKAKSMAKLQNIRDYPLNESNLDHFADLQGWIKLDSSSSTAPMVSYKRDDCRLNFWLSTGTVGSYLDHPHQGKTQLFRRQVAMDEVSALFDNPRLHTGRGYQHRQHQLTNNGRRCRYGQKCNNTNCLYDHSKPESGGGRGRCRYGNKCNRPDCYFDHPDGRHHSSVNEEEGQQVIDNNSACSISRECIECDSELCHATAPQKRCSRCHTVYYCSAACQRDHWKAHKPYCIDINEMRRKVACVGEDNETNNFDTEGVETNIPCAICLDEIVNPVIIPKCKHVFCFGCLSSWKEMSKHTAKCPICRIDIMDERDRKIQRAFLNAARANSSKYSEKKTEYYDAVYSDLDEILDKDDEDLQALFTKAEVLTSDKRYPGVAIDVVKKLMEINDNRKKYVEKFESMMREYELARDIEDFDECERLLELLEQGMDNSKVKRFEGGFDLLLLLALAYTSAGKWNEAVETYQGLMAGMADENGEPLATPPQQLKVFMGFTRCFYEIGEYDKAVSAGSIALEMNRHFPGVHKYIALAQKESGDLSAGIRTMKRAVLYETPWDDNNIAKAQELYKELQSLRSK